MKHCTQVKSNTETVKPYISTQYISILVINCELYKLYYKRKLQTQHNKQYTAKPKEVPLTTINISFIHIKKPPSVSSTSAKYYWVISSQDMNCIIYTNQGNSSLLSYSIQSNTLMPSTVQPTKLTYGESTVPCTAMDRKNDSSTQGSQQWPISTEPIRNYLILLSVHVSSGDYSQKYSEVSFLDWGYKGIN